MANTTTLIEKAQGHWAEIFNEFITDDRFHKALENSGKHVPSPFNEASQKDGFRLDPAFELKNGIGYDNAHGSMFGVDIIAKLTGDTINQTASKIHRFIDGKEIQHSKLTPEQLAQQKTDIEQAKAQQVKSDQKKINNAQKQVKKILAQTKNNNHLKKYLKSRGLGKAINNVNPAIFAVNNLYYDKQISTPAIVAPVFNNKGETVFLHRTYLNQQSEKNTKLENNKKVTPKIVSTAYYGAFGIKVNSANVKNSDSIHVVEGIETGLAVSIMTDNKVPVISTINTGGMVKFMPTNKSKHITIWADNDEAGIKAANALKSNLSNVGISVAVKIPKTKGDDFLDSYLAEQTKKNNENTTNTAPKTKGPMAQALANRRAKTKSNSLRH